MGRKALWIALIACTSLAAEASTIIAPGYSLYEARPPTHLDFEAPFPNPQRVDFVGNPIGAFDFGSGSQDVGRTDTIVQRTEVADLGVGSDAIELEIVALSLVSETPVDLGFGAGFESIFLTLNTSSPFRQSLAAIFDLGEGAPHGTYGGVLDLSFDVVGGVGGFYGTIAKNFVFAGQPWQHTPTGTVQISGVNHLLNGTEEEDFWQVGALTYFDSGMALTLRSALVPEPGSAVLLGIGLTGLSIHRSRRRRSKGRRIVENRTSSEKAHSGKPSPQPNGKSLPGLTPEKWASAPC